MSILDHHSTVVLSGLRGALIGLPLCQETLVSDLMVVLLFLGFLYTDSSVGDSSFCLLVLQVVLTHLAEINLR